MSVRFKNVVVAVAKVSPADEVTLQRFAKTLRVVSEEGAAMMYPL